MTDVSFPFFPDTVDAESTTGKRSRRRDSLFLTASLRVGNAEPVEVRVRNLSEGGLMAEGAPPLAIGTAVVIEMRAVGAVPGKVAWYTENRAGVAFDVPIDPKKARKPVILRARPDPARRTFAG